jgi:hypothetical protein
MGVREIWLLDSEEEVEFRSFSKTAVYKVGGTLRSKLWPGSSFHSALFN